LTPPGPDDAPPDRLAAKPLNVIPPLDPPDERLSYVRAKHVPLRYQVAQVFGILACVTSAVSWGLELTWLLRRSAAAGIGGIVVMLLTGLFVFAGDLAVFDGRRPRTLLYAIISTVTCILFLTITEVASR
jgi:drug/metabolite transporter (DMT)-like permease